MVVAVAEKIRELKEKAASKSINEEVGFLLRLLGIKETLFVQGCDGRKPSNSATKSGWAKLTQTTKGRLLCAAKAARLLRYTSVNAAIERRGAC
jgi:hypothetical protein